MFFKKTQLMTAVERSVLEEPGSWQITQGFNLVHPTRGICISLDDTGKELCWDLQLFDNKQRKWVKQHCSRRERDFFLKLYKKWKYINFESYVKKYKFDQQMVDSKILNAAVEEYLESCTELAMVSKIPEIRILAQNHYKKNKNGTR